MAFTKEQAIALANARLRLKKKQAEQEQPADTAPDEQGFYQRLQQEILEAPGGTALAELGAAINRGAVNVADFFVGRPIQAAQELAGVEEPTPTIAETELGRKATTGGYMEPGLARDVIQTGGELVAPGGVVGGTMRTAAKLVPATEAALTTGQRVLQQMGGSTATQDVLGSFLSGAGAEIGGEYFGGPGEAVGAFLFPVAGLSGKPVLENVWKSGKRGIESLMRPLAAVSDDGASTLLAEAMVREGLSPDDVVQKLQQLGPEAIPADVGNNFARLLRTASNKIPQIEGRAAEVLKARQAGQPDRIIQAIDDATGTPMNADEAIRAMEVALKPRINQLYKQAGSQSMKLSERLGKLLEGKSSLGRAQRRAQMRLADKRAAGDEITNIDLIDSTKQELDDQIGRAIRQGENNKARDLVRLKNIMIKEADDSIPEYKQARDLFAGKASLENAADAGTLFLKMKPTDVRDLTKTFSQSELKMFKMGARQAIMDKIDDLQTNADAVKRLFGKNGDVKKLRYLFDDNEAFKKFSEVLEREANFIMTRRAAQANSTTAKQLADEENAFSVLENMAEVVSSPAGQANIIRRIVNGLGKNKTDADYIKALEDAGDILLIKNIEPDRIKDILIRGNKKGIEARIKSALKKPTAKAYIPATTTGLLSEGTE